MRRERFKSWKDALEKNRGMVLYVFGTAGVLCALVGWGLLPDMVSANPAADNMELAYLTGAIISTVLFLSMLYANLGM